ncbi:transcription factor ATOH8 [Gastrophryne carolinensis]
MRNLQILEEAQWKGHCIKDITGIRRMKRKSRDVIKPLNGYPTFKVDLKVDASLKGAAQARPVVPSAELMDRVTDDGSEDALDLRSGVTQGRRGSVVTGTLETKSYGDHSMQSSIVVCPRPPETPYLSVSQVTYNNSSPDPCSSPRKRLGETAGVSTEIKAIQQTRRLLANARERTRVHTISAAFEALRKQVPCYSYGQKLSKLAILRIACNYILSLARLADLDYSADHSNLSFSECVEQCTRTLQSEGRSKKRKFSGNITQTFHKSQEIFPSSVEISQGTFHKSHEIFPNTVEISQETIHMSHEIFPSSVEISQETIHMSHEIFPSSVEISHETFHKSQEIFPSSVEISQETFHKSQEIFSSSVEISQEDIS